MTSTTYKWSIEDWHKLVESGLLEGKSVELLEGEIVNMSPEGISHSYTNRSVANHLRALLTNKAIISEAHPITLDNSEPEPDIAVVRLPETIYRHHHPYPEDIYWLVEISYKTLKIDLEQKPQTYARNGISEYWVIDLINKKLIVHTQPNNNGYNQVQEFTRGTVTSQSFPKIAIALEKILLF
ncbi:MAG: Uma2 family endonuclease [Cyanophyceae cyanobacterium]